MWDGIELNSLDGKKVDLGEYTGKVLLIVNVASKCGFTPQYKELEELHRKYQDRGLSVMGFPCNQFGEQEPGTAEEIAKFCELNFGTTFPLFEKIDVNGENAHPLFQKLKKECKGLMGTEKIKWNFTKFLVSKKGTCVERFAPQTNPKKIEGKIEELLN